MSIKQLQMMKKQMLRAGNFKEVERINKIIKFQMMAQKATTQ